VKQYIILVCLIDIRHVLIIVSNIVVVYNGNNNIVFYIDKILL
jgi:hypothetical protein